MQTSTKETPQEALERIQAGFSKNDGLVIAAFAGRGLDPDTIIPRENVLTYKAWQALGRQVRKGEKSVKLSTWIAVPGRENPETGKIEGGGSRPKAAFVFHITQTDEKGSE